MSITAHELKAISELINALQKAETYVKNSADITIGSVKVFSEGTLLGAIGAAEDDGLAFYPTKE